MHKDEGSINTDIGSSTKGLPSRAACAIASRRRVARIAILSACAITISIPHKNTVLHKNVVPHKNTGAMPPLVQRSAYSSTLKVFGTECRGVFGSVHDPFLSSARVRAVDK